jgi:hypothetical protein
VKAAFLFGSFAARLRGEPGGAPVDIDVRVVGEPDPVAVYGACRRIGDQVHREVNPTIMTAAGLRAQRLSLADPAHPRRTGDGQPVAG